MEQKNDSAVLTVLRETYRIYDTNGGNGMRHKRIREACVTVGREAGWSPREINQWSRITDTYVLEYFRSLKTENPMANKMVVWWAMDYLESVYRELDKISAVPVVDDGFTSKRATDHELNAEIDAAFEEIQIDRVYDPAHISDEVDRAFEGMLKKTGAMILADMEGIDPGVKFKGWIEPSQYEVN